MSQLPSQPVSELLLRWKAGDEGAFEELVPAGLQRAPRHRAPTSASGAPRHTLQSAALVHEAYLRLLGQRPFDTQNRAHFLAVASRLMRQILVDYARSHGAAKRGADRRVELDVSLVLPQVRNADVLALDDALNGLTDLDEQQDRIVELRFFAGLATEDCSGARHFSLDGQARLECGQGVVNQGDEERTPCGRHKTGKGLRNRMWAVFDRSIIAD